MRGKGMGYQAIVRQPVNLISFSQNGKFAAFGNRTFISHFAQRVPESGQEISDETGQGFRHAFHMERIHHWCDQSNFVDLKFFHLIEQVVHGFHSFIQMVMHINDHLFSSIKRLWLLDLIRLLVKNKEVTRRK